MAEEKEEEAAAVPAEDMGDVDDLVCVCAPFFFPSEKVLDFLPFLKFKTIIHGFEAMNALVINSYICFCSPLRSWT